MKSSCKIDCDYVMIRHRHWSLQKHQEKIRKIKRDKPKLEKSSVSCVKKQKNYSEVGREIEIERSNQILLEKILEINCRNSPKKKQKAQISVKSLNCATRKNEAQRIITENQIISKRINTQKSWIMKKVFDREFEMYQKYCSSMSRKHFLKYNQQWFPHKHESVSSNKLKIHKILENKSLKLKNSTPEPRKIPLSPQSNLLIEDDSSYEEDFQ